MQDLVSLLVSAQISVSIDRFVDVTRNKYTPSFVSWKALSIADDNARPKRYIAYWIAFNHGTI